MFCRQRLLVCSRVEAGTEKSHDYELDLGGSTNVAVEVEQIASKRGLGDRGLSIRNVGWHVRVKISEARNQIRAASHCGMPTVLLIYNAVDPMQLFGTEQHDFLAAMYRDLTVRIVRGVAQDPFRDRNAALQQDGNTSFSAIGRSMGRRDGVYVTLYENVFARHPLSYAEYSGVHRSCPSSSRKCRLTNRWSTDQTVIKFAYANSPPVWRAAQLSC
jgi:hypothetical protein